MLQAIPPGHRLTKGSVPTRALVITAQDYRQNPAIGKRLPTGLVSNQLNVIKGLNYLFSNAGSYAIPPNECRHGASIS